MASVSSPLEAGPKGAWVDKAASERRRVKVNMVERVRELLPQGDDCAWVGNASIREGSPCDADVAWPSDRFGIYVH